LLLVPLVSPEQLKLATQTSACIQKEWSPNTNYAKLGHRGSGSRDLLSNFVTPLIFSEWLKLETQNFVRTQRAGGPNANYAKLGDRGSGWGEILDPPHVSEMTVV